MSWDTSESKFFFRSKQPRSRMVSHKDGPQIYHSIHTVRLNAGMETKRIKKTNLLLEKFCIGWFITHGNAQCIEDQL